MLHSVNTFVWETQNLTTIISTMFQEHPLVQEALLFRISIADDGEKQEFLDRYSDINKALLLGKFSEDAEKTMCETIQKNHEDFCIQYYGNLLKNTQNDLEQHEKTTAQDVLQSLDF